MKEKSQAELMKEAIPEDILQNLREGSNFDLHVVLKWAVGLQGEPHIPEQPEAQDPHARRCITFFCEDKSTLQVISTADDIESKEEIKNEGCIYFIRRPA